MNDLTEVSSIALAGSALVGLIVGGALRHWWGVRFDRANKARIALLCDQLDIKDGKLQSMRTELRDEERRVVALQFEIEARAAGVVPVSGSLALVDTHAARPDRAQALADPLQLENNEDRALVNRRLRALQNPSARSQSS